jgi:invasion protein IalB
MHPSSHALAADQRRRVRVFPVALAALAVLAGSQWAAAQAPEAPQVAAWRVECTGDGKTLDCRAVQQLFQRDTRQLLVSLVVRPAADGKTGAMIAQLPLGLNLTEPITVRVNSGPAEKQSIQTCTNVGCFVAMTINDKLLAAMRGGGDLKIAMQDANKKPVEVSLPLLGFGLAFDKAK